MEKLTIRMRVVFERTDQRERGKNIVVRTVYCSREEAQKEFEKFKELNPHLGSELFGEWTAIQPLY